MDISTYLETARQKSGLDSNNKLAKCLGISKAAVSAIATGKALPAEDTILKLAKIAKIEPETALIDLAIIRNKKNADIAKHWQNIRAKLAH